MIRGREGLRFLKQSLSIRGRRRKLLRTSYTNIKRLTKPSKGGQNIRCSIWLGKNKKGRKN